MSARCSCYIGSERKGEAIQMQHRAPVLVVITGIMLPLLSVGCAGGERQQNADGGDCAVSAGPKRSTDGVKPGDEPGNKIAFARGHSQGGSDIYVVNPDGTEETPLTQTREYETNPVWSPDGDQIAFVRASDPNDIYQIENDIYVINADGSEETRLTHTERQGLSSYDSSQLAWSPDGRKIAFVDGSGGTSDIYTIDEDGANRTRLTNTGPSADGSTGVIGPVWSPDCEKIAFQRIHEVHASGSADADDSAGPGTYTVSEIYAMNADGTDLRKLPIESEYQDVSPPAWSPDGEKIAFQASRDIYTINADGTDQRYVTGNTVSSRPQWSPKGEIAFTGDTPSGTREIYKISADGTREMRLTHDAAGEEQLSWSPDGERLAYYSLSTVWTIYAMNADGTGRTRVADVGGSTLGPPSWGGTD